MMCKGTWKEKGRFVFITGCEVETIQLIDGKKIKVDKCLAPLLQAMNDYGIKTTYSCCGHGYDKDSGIVIKENGKSKTITFPYRGYDPLVKEALDKELLKMFKKEGK